MRSTMLFGNETCSLDPGDQLGVEAGRLAHRRRLRVTWPFDTMLSQLMTVSGPVADRRRRRRAHRARRSNAEDRPAIRVDSGSKVLAGEVVDRVAALGDRQARRSGCRGRRCRRSGGVAVRVGVDVVDDAADHARAVCGGTVVDVSTFDEGVQVVLAVPERVGHAPRRRGQDPDADDAPTGVAGSGRARRRRGQMGPVEAPDADVDDAAPQGGRGRSSARSTSPSSADTPIRSGDHIGTGAPWSSPSGCTWLPGTRIATLGGTRRRDTTC